MKRFSRYIPAITILTLIIVGVSGHVAHADGPFFGYGFHDLVTGLLAEIVNTLLSAVAWLLTIAGVILNMSMNLTLHMKEFIDGTPAVYTVWKSIRDISGMFIIFTLLFAALKMILAPIGVPGASAGNLIKTVVIAGILINFSFFVAALGIDVSNVVSMQLYSSIAPISTLDYAQLVGTTDVSVRSKFDGGISDIFMKSLKISNFYDAKTAALSPSGNDGPGTGSASLQIILGGIFGIVVMLTAAASFFLAALAFIVRFVALIMLLGFSPIWFAAYAVPDLKPYADKWAKNYKSQLLFMPVYLLLMYFALSVLNSSNLFQNGFATNQSTGGEWWANFMILGINAAIVIIMLNAPLLAAISIGAIVPKWAEKAGAGALWKRVGGMAQWGAATAGGFAGRNTIGWAGEKTDKYLANTRLGNTLIGRDIRSATIGKVAAGKYGGKRSYGETAKEQKSVDQKQREMDRASDIKALIASGAATPDQFAAIIKVMGEKERLALGKDTLKNPEVLKHLKKSDFEAIKKSDDFSPEDVAEIKTARKDAFSSAVTTGEKDVVKHMMNNMEIEDIIADETLLKNNNLIEELTPDKLKKIAAEGISEDTKHEIAKNILTWRTNPADPQHKAFGWMSKDQNHGEWLKTDLTANGRTYHPA